MQREEASRRRFGPRSLLRSLLRLAHTRSLRVRFGLGVVGLMVVALALFGAFVYLNVDKGLRSGVDDSLRLSASQAAATIDLDNGKLVLGDSLSGSNTALGSLQARGHTVRYLGPNGEILGGFGSLWNSPVNSQSLAAARTGRPAFFDLSDAAADKDYRLYTLPVVSGQNVVGYVQVFQSLDSVEETLAELLAALLAGGALITVAGGLGGYFLAGRALAPIDAITRTARRISARDLSARLNVRTSDDEVGRLASTFDEMLARLESSFKRERQFTADASHELRTPLAAMEAILSVVRSEPRTAAEYEEALDDLAEETARLRALAEDLLRLARGAQPISAEFAPVDISMLVQDVADALRPLAEAKGLYLRSNVTQDLTLTGDSDSLIRVFLNLVDNAIKFTEQGGVTVRAYSDGGAAVVDVSDTGVGIPPERLPSIFERFYRVDSSRSTQGTGLGLALALQIVQNHGGTISARSSEGEGSTFTVRFGKKTLNG